jgi:hypothetical protein
MIDWFMFKKSILPQFESSYETIIHKKIYHYTHILIIPEGTPSYLWIHQKGTFLINDKINKKIILSCHPSLQKGTLLYGTHFQYNDIFFFAIQDGLYYKGNNISKSSFQQKLIIFETILKSEIQQQPTNHADEMIIGLPIIVENDYLVKNYIKNTPYPIQYIQYRNYSKQRGNHRFQLPIAEFNENYCIMNVSADIEYDIYHLIGKNDKKSYGMACIPDYKTSVLMNSIFRNIKENANLDAIEESDDEYEKEEPTQFVDLTLIRQMKCKYHSHFKKWVPIELV